MSIGCLEHFGSVQEMVRRGQTQRSNPSKDKKLQLLEELYAALSERRFQHVVDVVSNRLRTGKRSPALLYLVGLAWIGLEDLAQGATVPGGVDCVRWRSDSGSATIGSRLFLARSIR